MIAFGNAWMLCGTYACWRVCGKAAKLPGRFGSNIVKPVDHRPSSFWLDRPTFITGATGLVGSWLVRWLLGLGADVVCLVRDWVPQSELARGQLIEQVKVVRGDVCDRSLLERVLGEYEID